MTVRSSIDIPFAPRLVHRLRLTDGVFTPSNPTLRDLMAADGPAHSARACVYIDSGLAAAQPRLVESVHQYFAAGSVSHRLVLPPQIVPGGEAAKNDRAALDSVIQHLHDAKLCRKSYAIAVGGGAVLDVVGLAAALAHRGVRLIRIPTTTLSQGDSCVAVKNGINLFGLKNYLGSFAAPWGVVIDPSLLATLSDRDWRSGFSEAVKVALIKDAAFFDRLESTAAAIAARQIAPSEDAILRSAELHLRHITDGGDPFELTEARPLDFGHWAAHRLETLTKFDLKHGEAVAIGIAIDTEYSHLSGMLSAGDRDRVFRCLTSLRFHLPHPALGNPDAVMAGIDQFREHLGGRLTLAMLKGIGRGHDVHDVDRARMVQAIGNIHARGQ
jgi:3-dehydroquinate synthase